MKRILLLAGTLLLALFPLAAQTDFGYLLDTTFAGTGQVVRNDEQEWRPIKTVLHPDGGFIILGRRLSDGVSVLCRYQADGIPMPDWGETGLLALTAKAVDLTARPDGRLLLCGTRPDGFGGSLTTLFELLPNGSLDATFGQDGVAVLPDSLTLGWGKALCLQNDQQILLAVRPTAEARLAVLRFAPNGVLDPTFVLSIPAPLTITGEEFLPNVIVSTQGDPIWVSGYKETTIFGQNLLAGWLKHWSGGQLTEVATGFNFPRTLQDQTLFSDNGLAILATDNAGGNPVQVSRYNSEGTPDHTFGTTGVQKISFFAPTSENSYSGQMDVDTAGRMLVGVLIFDQAPWDARIGLARLLPDGDLDTSFGNDGIVSFGGAAPPGNFTLYELNVLAQPDGKVLLTGLRDPLGSGQNQVFALLINPDATVSLPTEPTATRRWTAFPNPVLSGESLTFLTDLPTDGARWRLLDCLGRSVGEGTVTGGKVPVPAGCTAGCYYLHLRHADGSASTLPVVVVD